MAMSAIEQALRQIDLLREGPSSAGKTRPTIPISPVGLLTAAEPVPSKGRTRWAVVVLVIVIAAALAWQVPSGRQVGAAIRAGASTFGSALPGVAAAALLPAIAQPKTTVPVFQPDTGLSASTAVAPGEAPRATWLVNASTVWNSGAWEQASRLWMEGLRATTPSALALQIADAQTLEEAQQLHQTWSVQWPVVVLAAPTGPQWLVLALPGAGAVDAAQHQLSHALGRPVHWASVMQWVARVETGPALAPTAAACASAKMAETVAVAATTVAPAIKESRPDKEVAVARAQSLASVSPPPPSPSPSTPTSTTTAAGAPPQAPKEQPQMRRSGGATLDDQARAVLATKAIDVDFSGVEQLLAKGDFTKALTAAEQLEAYIGPNWRTQYLAGVALSGLGHWAEAVSALTNARQKNPAHVRATLYLAVALQETGDHASAIDILLRATAAHPQVPELWLNQGHSMQAQGLTSEASQAYRRFLDLSATRADLSAQRSWVSQRLQRGS